MELLWNFINQILNHTKLSDMAMALMGLFLFSSLVQRLTTKGPMLWPVVGIIPSFVVHFGHVHEWITDAANKAGGTFPFRALPFARLFGVVTVDPSVIEYVLKTRFKNFPKGEYYRERFAELLGDGIFNADDEVWKEQRRAATAEIHAARFVDHSVKSIEELVRDKLLKLLEKLEKSNQSVDLQDILLRFTFDNICTAAFGVDPGCLAIDLPEVPFARAFEQATQYTLFRFMVPPFVWKTMRFFCFGTEKCLREAVKVVHQFAEKCVTDRRIECQKQGGLEGRFDLLSRLIEAQDSDAQSVNYRFPDKFLKDLCISFILAGRDTSSVALAWFFWLVHKHPEVENRYLSEIPKIKSWRRLQREKERSATEQLQVFTIGELKKMVYLQAALSEASRLYPSVPIDFKEVLEDDVFPDGTPIKKGAKVIYSPYAMARMEAIWGKDCREFRPERWIREGQFMSENQFKYVVFNAGPRLCIGKKFAFMQMKMVAASILSKYSVCVDEGHVVAPKITTTLYMKYGLQVTFKRRVSHTCP
ncbi:cytochrome P450 86B1-like [Aristolochia californica]|uniref:cytochrome P450 86B1-like n=1 Tax=Aristolochia californica TaxID=171875 RepID=UPI0035D792DB